MLLFLFFGFILLEVNEKLKVYYAYGLDFTFGRELIGIFNYYIN